jgi:hypothetical protein
LTEVTTLLNRSTAGEGSRLAMPANSSSLGIVQGVRVDYVGGRLITAYHPLHFPRRMFLGVWGVEGVDAAASREIMEQVWERGS